MSVQDTASVVRYEKRVRVAYVTLDRPAVLNAMNLRMHEQLAENWETSSGTRTSGSAS